MELIGVIILNEIKDISSIYKFDFDSMLIYSFIYFLFLTTITFPQTSFVSVSFTVGNYMIQIVCYTS